MITRHRDFLLKISDSDLAIYNRVIRFDSPLLDALEIIPWESLRPGLEKYYSPKRGQPALSVILMIKLEYLRYACRLSDRDVIERARTDLLFRWFLQVPIDYPMPDPSTLCRFRGRIGEDGFQEIFDQVVGVARDAGIVRDRLRLKDATHVLANMAVPTTLSLLAQLRQKIIAAIEPVDAEVAAGYRVQAEQNRIETEKESDEIRLQTRLELVLDMLHWMRQLPKDLPENQDEIAWQRLLSLRDLAEKITGDCLNPDRGDRTLSVVDPEARRAMHGDFFDGYLLDAITDADSEIITQIEVLPGNGAEAQDAIDLVNREEAAHGNQIEQISIDGAGFNGAVLRELEDPAGLAVDVITPPRDFVQAEGFASSMFTLVEDGDRVECPAGQTSNKAWRKSHKPNSTFFDFSAKTCHRCALLSQCHATLKPTARTGRRVNKNDYEEEYQRAWEKSKTEAYQQVRKEHPAIERKLGEIVRHGRGRHAKYWGRSKVKVQLLMTCLVVNIRRLVKLLGGSSCAEGLQRQAI